MGTNTDKERDGEDSLRGRNISGSDQKSSVDHLEQRQKRNPDNSLHTDGEEDTLYEDGLELDDDTTPLTGVNGVDDSR